MTLREQYLQLVDHSDSASVIMVMSMVAFMLSSRSLELTDLPERPASTGVAVSSEQAQKS
jgi:hypothetical protein